MTPTRQITTRRIAFEHPGSMPHHYMNGDPVMSHVLAVLSSLFPEGEDFFVQSVRNYRDKITDPELRKQVGGFIGQEAIHGREHRAFNDELNAMGYPTHLIDRLTKYGLGILAKVTPKADRLAVTAALEHYTATLAEVLMSSEDGRAFFSEPEVRSLLLWHAIEESEHKSVAFDVFQAVNGRHWLRARVMDLTTVGFLFAAVAGTALSLALDPSTYRHPIRVARSLRGLRQNPWLSKEVRARIRDYNRKDFHPDDHDATELLTRWRAELFGTDGTLADRIRGAAA
jgi:predicted metal-dependent hydrolase